MSGQRSALVNLALVLLVWEIVGQFDWVAGGALPAPSEILRQWWHDRAVYPRHIGTTLYWSACRPLRPICSPPPGWRRHAVCWG